jgi:2-dehydropantoate 2-reductase
VIGSVYALRLAKSGSEVTVIARGDRLKTLRGGGLVIRQVFLEEEEEAAVEVLDGPPIGTRFDLVLVTVRADQIVGALRDIARLPRPKAVVVIGNNLGPYAIQAGLVGEEILVLGFGVFGGYREEGVIAYADGRTKKRPRQRTRTTLGLVKPEARPALVAAIDVFEKAGLPCRACRDMPAWLLCHAALVFPLAGAIYAAGGEQEACCGTRDAIVLGLRAFKELFAVIRSDGRPILPWGVRLLLALPEPAFVRLLARRLAGEEARVAVFGHALAPGGRDEIGKQAMLLDSILRRPGRALEAWDRLLPYFAADCSLPAIREGADSIPLRPW